MKRVAAIPIQKTTSSSVGGGPGPASWTEATTAHAELATEDH